MRDLSPVLDRNTHAARSAVGLRKVEERPGTDRLDGQQRSDEDHGGPAEQPFSFQEPSSAHPHHEEGQRLEHIEPMQPDFTEVNQQRNERTDIPGNHQSGPVGAGVGAKAPAQHQADSHGVENERRNQAPRQERRVRLEAGGRIPQDLPDPVPSRQIQAQEKCIGVELPLSSSGLLEYGLHLGPMDSDIAGVRNQEDPKDGQTGQHGPSRQSVSEGKPCQYGGRDEEHR